MVDTNYHSESIHLTLHTQGFMLFDTHSSVEHLAMMEVVRISWNRFLKSQKHNSDLRECWARFQ